MRTLLFLLTCSPLLLAATADDAVRAAEKSFSVALVQSDAVALERLLSPDLSYGHASGKLDSKQSYIDRIRSGAQKYVSFRYDSESPIIHVYGKSAVLIAAAEIESVTDGQPNRLHLRFLHVWIHNSAGWQLAAHQSVKLPPQ